MQRNPPKQRKMSSQKIVYICQMQGAHSLKTVAALYWTRGETTPPVAALYWTRGETTTPVAALYWTSGEATPCGSHMGLLGQVVAKMQIWITV